MTKKSGRKSAAELAIVVDITHTPPPEPPAELNDDAALLWRATVGAMPGKWLHPGARPLLVDYCRRVGRLRWLELQIEAFDADWLKVEGGVPRLDAFLRMADRESKAIVNLARALRLSPHTQMHPRSAARQMTDVTPNPARPWDPVE